MKFCTNCGNKLNPGDKFCPQCGAPTHEQSEPKQDVSICSQCGAALKPGEAVCPFCGNQIEHRDASYSIQKFSDELAEIERDNDNKSKFPILNSINMLIDKGYGDRVFKRKISLIQNFPIPNTIEEITEFLLMAEANIDVRYGKNTLSNRLGNQPGSTYYTEIKLANVWINKMKQAYIKAQMLFPNTPEFYRIQKIYFEEMKELKIKV